EGQRQSRAEGAPAELDRWRRLDAAVAHKRYVGGAAADIDEEPALAPRFLAGASKRERIRLCDRGCKLEVELPHDRVDGVNVSYRRECVEDGDLEVLAREADRVGHRIAVDSDVGDGRMDEARLQLAIAPFELEEVLRLAQSP